MFSSNTYLLPYKNSHDIGNNQFHGQRDFRQPIKNKNIGPITVLCKHSLQNVYGIPVVLNSMVSTLNSPKFNRKEFTNRHVFLGVLFIKQH